jgi:hypothetical protein
LHSISGRHFGGSREGIFRPQPSSAPLSPACRCGSLSKEFISIRRSPPGRIRIARLPVSVYASRSRSRAAYVFVGLRRPRYSIEAASRHVHLTVIDILDIPVGHFISEATIGTRREVGGRHLHSLRRRSPPFEFYSGTGCHQRPTGDNFPVSFVFK